MAKQIFVNLPIGNLKTSMAFYDAMGFKNNPQFTNDDAACMYSRAFTDPDGHIWEKFWMDPKAIPA